MIPSIIHSSASMARMPSLARASAAPRAMPVAVRSFSTRSDSMHPAEPLLQRRVAPLNLRHFALREEDTHVEAPHVVRPAQAAQRHYGSIESFRFNAEEENHATFNVKVDTSRLDFRRMLTQERAKMDSYLAERGMTMKDLKTSIVGGYVAICNGLGGLSESYFSYNDETEQYTITSKITNKKVQITKAELEMMGYDGGDKMYAPGVKRLEEICEALNIKTMQKQKNNEEDLKLLVEAFNDGVASTHRTEEIRDSVHRNIVAYGIGYQN